jgi:hypothetical protein
VLLHLLLFLSSEIAMPRRTFVMLGAATLALLMLSAAARSVDDLEPRLRPGAIAVTGQEVRVLDGEGNFFTTSDTHIVIPPQSSNVLFIVTMRDVPNPDRLTVHWTFSNTGIPCLFGQTSCPWQMIIRRNGEATLIGHRQPVVLLDGDASQWDSEAFSTAAADALAKIAAGITVRDPSVDLTHFVGPEFQCRELRPQLQPTWSRLGIHVLRQSPPTGEPLPDAEYKGAEGLAGALRSLARPLCDAQEVRVDFKIVRVNREAGTIVTTSRYQASGRTHGGSIQQNAMWRCRWQGDLSDPSPRLHSIEVSDYEEIRASLPSKSIFVDCTQAALAGCDSFSRTMRRSSLQWSRELDLSFGSQIVDVRGLAIGDVNGDGLEDLYVCQQGGLPNRLLIARPGGVVDDVSAWGNVDWLDATYCALFVDLDNDGDQDLALGMSDCVLLMANDSQGRFQLRHTLHVDERGAQCLAAADYDNDGDLDLFLGNGWSGRTGTGDTYRDYTDAHVGSTDHLFRNDTLRGRPDNWTFMDVTAQVGLNDDRQTLAAAWEDYDDDGDQDLYLANDFGPNALFRNDKGRFVNVAKEAGVLDLGSGMSVSWSDYDRDGRMDLYVGNMFSSAGNRITHFEEKLRHFDHGQRSLLQRFAKGNSLFRNLGGGNFQEVGQRAGVEMGRWAWSSLFVDLNNDGWDDVLVANGFLTNENPHDL